MIKVQGVYLAYTKDYNTLNDINFELPMSKQLTIFGSKDSGKSSLTRLILGLEKPTKGKIFIKEIPVSEINFKKDVFLGYLPFQPIFLNNKTVLENLEYVLKIRAFDKNARDVAVNNALYEYSLSLLKNEKVKNLSDFDKLKLAIARLSLRKIELFIVDDLFERFSDAQNKEIATLLKKLIRSNQSAAIVMTASKLVRETFNYTTYVLDYGSLLTNEEE